VASPLSKDTAAFTHAMNRVDSLQIEDGTAIGSSILVSANALLEYPQSYKYILLFTDGSDNAGRIAPRTAAEIARLYGIRLYIVGLGDLKESLYPTTDALGKTTYIKLPADIDSNLFTELARSTGGEFYRVTNNAELNELQEKINVDIKKHVDDEYPQTENKISKEKAKQLMKMMSSQ